MKSSFISDNASCADPRIIKAFAEANAGFALPYGNDQWSKEAEELFKAEFGENILYFPLLTGTGANVTSLASILLPHQCVLCAETSHINVDECGAVERFTGSKLVTVHTDDGKLAPELLEPCLHGLGFEHHSQPKAVSISQVTETGTVYTETELKALSDFTKANNLILHMDGARIANAAAFLGISLKDASKGADILSFGGTKNGLAIGEAVIFLNPELAENTKYFRKQYGQLFSKMRYVSAQFIPYLKDGIWHENASKANRSAAVLAAGLMQKGISIHYPVNGNSVFAFLSEKQIEKLSDKFLFYVWEQTTGLCRFVCSYATPSEDVAELLETI